MSKKLGMEQMVGNDLDKYNSIIQNQNQPVSDEISLKAISELFDTKKKLKTISRIKFEQVSIISKLFMYTDTFGTSYTKNLANYMLQLQISVSGLSRREIVQMVQQRSMFEEVPQSKRTKDIFN